MNDFKDIVEQAGPTTLVLIDELGSGTDPDEGASLSQAILERVLEGGARGVVTTHLAPLKVFASQADGVVNAAMRFDLEELRPTYELVVGQPGRSYALAIAERIGLDSDLLARASELLGEEAGRLERLLATLEEQRALLTTERDEAQRTSDVAVKEAEVLREQIAKLREREEELIAAAAARAEELLGETLQRATRLKRTATSQPGQRSKALDELQELRRAARDAARQRRGPGPAPDSRAEDVWRPGTLVHVPEYNAQGRVIEERGDAVLVSPLVGLGTLLSDRFSITACAAYKWLCAPRGAGFLTVDPVVAAYRAGALAARTVPAPVALAAARLGDARLPLQQALKQGMSVCRERIRHRDAAPREPFLHVVERPAIRSTAAACRYASGRRRYLFFWIYCIYPDI